MRRTLQALRTPLLVIAPVLTLTACQTNPATGRSYLALMDRQQSIEVGNSAAPELTEGYGGAISDATINNYVRDVGMSMTKHTEADYPTLPWEFTVLDSDVINAFALPGGKVFISRALLEEMNTEAQMAGVIGHEIGHVTAEHVNERVTRQMGLQIGVVAVSAILSSQSDSELVQYAVPALATGAGVFALKYDRDQELESDRLGVRYMSRAGYNPRGQLDVMQILGRAAEGAERPPEWQSTHPHAETRIDALQHLLKTEYAFTQNNPEFVENSQRFEQLMLSRLRQLPPPQGSRARTALMPVLAEGQALPPEVQLLLDAQWCGVCRSELAALRNQTNTP